jgi:ABC-type Mn2+/Zn2+ transport system ATPase subunit
MHVCIVFRLEIQEVLQRDTVSTFGPAGCEEHMFRVQLYCNVALLRLQVVAHAVSAVGLAGCEERAAGQLSGGQRRKLSLASALVGGPSVVLVDEPTSGMDPHTRRCALHCETLWDVAQAAWFRVSVMRTH